MSMNRNMAEYEARRRWGKSADVFEAKTAVFVWDGKSEITNGRGPTWEDAFDNAALRERLAIEEHPCAY